MNKDEILEKYGVVFENFCPAPGAAIKITADMDMVDVDTVSFILDELNEMYPEKTIFTTFKGIEVN